jgi:hypothetical protein
MARDHSITVTIPRKRSLPAAFPAAGIKLIQAVSYAHSIGRTTAKLEVKVSDSTTAYYFLKVAYDNTSAAICNILMAASRSSLSLPLGASAKASMKGSKPSMQCPLDLHQSLTLGADSRSPNLKRTSSSKTL